MLGERENAPRYFFVELLVSHPSERKLSTEHSVKKHTAGPYVSRRTDIFALAADLGAHIGRRATEDFQLNVVGR